MKPLYVPQFETLNVINEEEKKAVIQSRYDYAC